MVLDSRVRPIRSLRDYSRPWGQELVQKPGTGAEKSAPTEPVGKEEKSVPTGKKGPLHMLSLDDCAPLSLQG